MEEKKGFIAEFKEFIARCPTTIGPSVPNGGRQHDGPAEKHRPQTNEHVIPRRSEAELWESASPVPWGKEYGLPRPCGPRNDMVV